MNEYQQKTRETAIYPKETALAYLALGLNGESGEVADKLKKHIRDGKPFDKESLILELGDVLWYIARLSDELGVSLQDVADKNIAKLMDRKQRNALKGSGDNR